MRTINIHKPTVLISLIDPQFLATMCFTILSAAISKQQERNGNFKIEFNSFPQTSKSANLHGRAAHDTQRGVQGTETWSVLWV
jgi:hypothetical protein